MKLHLGCGQKYLDGYINIDFPPDQHTVQLESVADLLCDIKKLDYKDQSIDEVRSHHFFEHFPRQDSLALLCRWTDWLRTDGLLRIETPDFQSSIYRFVSPFVSYDEKEQILRHLFGSHEAHWAVHYDAWYEARYRKVLTSLGYKNLQFTKNTWGATKNIEVFATRGSKVFDFFEYKDIIQNFLIGSLIKEPIKNDVIDLTKIPQSELEMLSVWMDQWQKTYTYTLDK